MHNILIISYFFPPDGGAGTQRALKLCKYLPRKKWRITVLTREIVEKRSELDPEDQSLLNEIKDDVFIVRLRINEDKKIKNKMQFFTDSLLESVSELHIKKKFDIIFITLSPFQMAKSGYLIEKKLKVPVVLDIRDPWLFDGWNVYRHYFIWLYDYIRMKKHISGVSGLITNTPEVEKVYKKIFKKNIKTKITYITNGYDYEDFINETSNTSNNNKFILSHTGFFHSSVLFQPKTGLKVWIKKKVYYHPRKLFYEGRTPYFLFKAVKYLEEINSDYIDRLIIYLVGIEDPYTKLLVQEFGLENKITFVGYVSHEESVHWLKKSDGLFIPLHEVEKGRAYIVPGKLYEYLASDKPILGAFPEGDAKDFVINRGLSYLAKPCDYISIAIALENMMKDHFNGSINSSNIDHEYIKRFERKNLSEEFSKFFLSVIDSKG